MVSWKITSQVVYGKGAGLVSSFLTKFLQNGKNWPQSPWTWWMKSLTRKVRVMVVPSGEDWAAKADVQLPAQPLAEVEAQAGGVLGGLPPVLAGEALVKDPGQVLGGCRCRCPGGEGDRPGPRAAEKVSTRGRWGWRYFTPLVISWPRMKHSHFSSEKTVSSVSSTSRRTWCWRRRYLFWAMARWTGAKRGVPG